jgi:hypothetical protein
MTRYGKTPNIFKRNPDTHKLLPGVYSRPEFDDLKRAYWEMSEKIDGMNIRILWTPNAFEETPDEGLIEIRGRSDGEKIPQDLVDNMWEFLWPENFKKVFGSTPACIYGEGFGPGIQKNGGLYSPKKTFRAFDIILGENFLSTRDKFHEMIDALEIPKAPVVLTSSLTAGVARVQNGLKSTFGDFYAEGLVARPYVELKNTFGERVICKIKHKELYYGRNEK